MQGAVTIGFTGYEGGELMDLADHRVVVPAEHIDQIEDVHLMLCHLIVDGIHSALLEVMGVAQPQAASREDNQSLFGADLMHVCIFLCGPL